VTSKSVIYLSIVFSSFFVGSLIPINMILGAPLSLVTLAYFQPYLKTKLTLTVFLLLSFFNIVMMLPNWVALYITINSYLGTIKFTIPAWFTMIYMGCGFMLGRLIVLNTANKLIKKSKVRERYPL